MRVTLVTLVISTFTQIRGSYLNEGKFSLKQQRLFEGDILLRKNQDPWDRNAVTNKNARWPVATVPYLLDPAYDEKEADIIISAMEEIENSTSCIKFVPRKEERDFIGIYSGNGCWASLGRADGIQLLSLQKSKCIVKGVAMHELMHGIGFLHEHTRPDRDDYITIHWDNIIDEVKRNFQKISFATLDTLNETYDYRSVMHYHAWAFSKDRLHPTMTPKQSGFSHESLGYGQAKGKLTSTDIRKVRKFYECQNNL